MKRSSKILLTTLVLVIFMLGLALVATKAILNFSSFKSKIESAVSDTLDMDFKIEGRINLGFFPYLWLAVNNITVSVATDGTASADQIKITPHLLELWSLKVHIKELHIENPKLKFNRQAIEKVRALNGKKIGGLEPVKSLAIDSFSISDLEVFYSDDQKILYFKEMDFNGGGIVIAENNKFVSSDFVSLLKTINFKGDMQAGQITSQDLKIENISASVTGENGTLTLDPIELEYFGERAKLAGHIGLEENDYRIRIGVEMIDLDLDNFHKKAGHGEIIRGLISIRGEFETSGGVSDEMLRNLNGSLSIKGRDLTLKGIDFDRALDEFDEIRGYGFNDLAVLVTLGPLGKVISHGYNQLADLEKIMAASDDSTIQVLIADWRVAQGVVTARDVAFSTRRNRFAVKGSLDIPNERFSNVIVAIVDAEGCIVNSETVEGPFANPEVKEAGVLERTVIRPLKRMFKSDCEFFYDGAVPHPVERRVSE